MNTNMKRFNIENGPNVDRILDGFKYAYDESANVPLAFLVAKGYTAPIGDPGCAFAVLDVKDFIITMVEHECGNSYSLNIGGYCKVEDERARFEAYYNAKTRKGTITFFS